MSGVSRKKTPEKGTVDRGIDLVEFSVVLVVKSNDPSIVNPDFLRYNAIVDANLPVQEPPITTFAFSQAIFKGGLAVKALPERMIFEQTGSPLAEEDIRCVETAKRYLEKAPQVSCNAVGINPKGIRESSGTAREKVSNALIERGSWASFRAVVPEILLKAAYRYEDRMIALDISNARTQEEGGSEASVMMFQANIHRDIREVNQQQRVAKLSSILESWREDLADFHSLVDKFDSRRFRP